MIINSIKPYNFNSNLQKEKISFCSVRTKPDSFEKTKNEEKPTLFKRIFHKKPKKEVLIQEGQFVAPQSRHIFNRHTTCYFRSDLEWFEFADLLRERFKDNDKVNTYVWGCSYGDEPYTLSMALKRLLKDESDKFYPIKAIDINPAIVGQCKKEQEQGVILTTFNKSRVVMGLGLNIKEAEDLFKPMSKGYYYLNKNTTDTVNFEHGNIVTDIKSMDSENPSIVMCRNMWPYVNPAKYQKCAQELYDTLAKGSIVVLGGYDHTGEVGIASTRAFPKELVKAGFQPLYNCAIGCRSSYDEDELKKYALVYEKV